MGSQEVSIFITNSALRVERIELSLSWIARIRLADCQLRRVDSRLVDQGSPRRSRNLHGLGQLHIDPSEILVPIGAHKMFPISSFINHFVYGVAGIEDVQARLL